MIVASEEAKSYLKKNERTFKAKLVCGSNTFGLSKNSLIESLKIESTLGSDNLSVGGTGCAKLEVKIFDERGFKFQGNRFKVFIGFENDGTDTWEQLGEFKAEKPTKKDGLTSFVAYDRMNETGSVFKSALTYPTTYGAVWAELCRAATGSDDYCEPLPNFSGNTIQKDVLSGYTIRTAMGYLAAYLAFNVVVNRNGKFEMRKIKTTPIGEVISPASCEPPETEEEDYKLEYIVCNIGEDKEPLKKATGNRGFSFACPFMNKSRLNDIATAYLYDSSKNTTVSYRVGTVNVAKGDFRIEVGDWLTYAVDAQTLLTFPVMRHTFEFDGGIMNTLEAFGKTPEEDEGSVLSLEERIKSAVNDKAYSAAESATKAVKAFSDTINNAIGLYSTEITDSNGSTQVYLHNAETLENSTYIATINDGGFAFATGVGCWNGGSPTWTSGMTKEGNAIANTLQVGDLTALSAKISGWKIGTGSTFFPGVNSIYSEVNDGGDTYGIGLNANFEKASYLNFYVKKKSGNTTEDIFYITNAGKLYAKNAVIAGEITASSGKIGGWNIGTGSLFYPNVKSIYSDTITSGTDKYEIGLKADFGEATYLNYYVKKKSGTTEETIFYISNAGKLYAKNAEIQGKITATSGSFTGEITATSGSIGGFTIKSDYLTFGTIGTNNSFAINPAGTSSSHNIGGRNDNQWALMIGSNFGVTCYGNLYAENVHLKGEITATSGSFTGKVTASSGSIAGFEIYSNRLHFGTAGESGSFVLNPAGTNGSYTIAGYKKSGWAMMIGSNFGVTTDGTLRAKDVLLNGITAINGISATGGITADQLWASTEVYIPQNSVIKFATSSTASAIGMRYASNGLCVGIAASNLRLYGSNVYLGSTTTTVTSDARLKKELSEFTASHEDFFFALKPKTFKYINGTSDRVHFGFIAQEMKEAIESSGLTTQQAAAYVELESDDETLGEIECAIRYDEIIPLNTYMIQKLWEEVNLLKAKG